MSILSESKTCLTHKATSAMLRPLPKSGIFSAMKIGGFIRVRGRVFADLRWQQQHYLADVVTGTLYDVKSGHCLSTHDPEMQLDLSTAEKVSREDALAFFRDAPRRAKIAEWGEEAEV